ncbi:MAG TPA: ROK family protein [Anaerolineales bacterium]|nr:ROK family protein [Anaerolineales bacterium]
MSRVELARQIGLTRAAMTQIVNDLLASGTIHEIESSNSKSGRPPIILEINPQGGHIVGIDIGATHVNLVVTDFSGRVLDEVEIPFNVKEPPIQCLDQVDRLFRETLAKMNLKLDDIEAIGVGVPGPVDTKAGMVIAPPIMPGWDRFPIRETLEKRWGCPIALANDAELGALGEWAYGAARGEKNIAYIKVGTGIGAGLLLDGQIYHGISGAAGEIGHLTMIENGPICNCGNAGCLETLAGGMAIARQAQEAVRKGQRTMLSEITPIEAITTRDVSAIARRGDRVAQQIIVQAGRYLGIAIAGMVNLFNPTMIVFGGGVAQIGDLFLQPIRDEVQKRSLPAAVRTLRIQTAVLRRRSSSMGAVVLALSMALHKLAEAKERR